MIKYIEFPIHNRELFRKVKEIKGLCGGVRLVRRTNKSRRLTQRLRKRADYERKLSELCNRL